ncbi:acyl-CoA thioesterase [Roseateles chitosanitabidus]|uniref:acyl-CoA thioesterase n=1 Tax=Roseateles chitosanitabidus TaxID=65048 RepID=UPI000A037FEB|nr:acyl-CoA thioesterase [Roseateles chitosanitabidus]
MRTPQASIAALDWTRTVAALPPGELHRTELIVPSLANHYGTLFAPEGLAMLGRVAYLTAAQHSVQPVVMASAGEIDFLVPVPVGALLHLHGRVTRVGASSLTVQVHAAIDEDAGTAFREALRGSFELVAVDGDGRPVRLRTRQSREGVSAAARSELPYRPLGDPPAVAP